MIKIKTTTGPNYLVLFAITFIFTLFFCSGTSPIIDKHTMDSSIFIAMGKMFIDGMTPYSDFFDHKGPVIIFLQALGQLIIPYRTGIFFLEIVNMFLVLIVIDRTARLFFKGERIIILILFFCLFLTQCNRRGNYVEEYSLLPLFVSLYIGCKYHFINNRISALQGFIMGLCFSFLFWIRLNNAGLLCGITIYIFISTLMDKDYKSLLNLVFYFILGQLPLLIFFVGYFYYVDALYDMIYATFIFNFKYLDSLIVFFHKRWWMNLLIFAFIAVGSYLDYKRNKNKKIFILSLLIFAFSFLTINIGYVFRHYFILFCPALVYGVLLLLKEIENKKVIDIIFKTVVSISIIITIIYAFFLIKDMKKTDEEVAAYKNSANELLHQIPKNDEHRVYYYEIETKFYTIMKLNPNYKYFIFQEWHGNHDPDIVEKIEKMMKEKNRPLWVFMQKEEANRNKLNPTFETVINKDYKLHSENDIFILYQLNSEVEN